MHFQIHCTFNLSVVGTVIKRDRTDDLETKILFTSLRVKPMHGQCHLRGSLQTLPPLRFAANVMVCKCVKLAPLQSSSLHLVPNRLLCLQRVLDDSSEGIQCGAALHQPEVSEHLHRLKKTRALAILSSTSVSNVVCEQVAFMCDVWISRSCWISFRQCIFKLVAEHTCWHLCSL